MPFTGSYLFFEAALGGRQEFAMKPHHYLFDVLAMALAYGAVLTPSLLIDFAFDTRCEWLVIVWFNIGIAVMRWKNMDFPSPDMRRIDVLGGLRVLWWALFWPTYLGRK